MVAHEKIKITRIDSKTLQIKFPESIDKMVKIAKKKGEIQPEYLIALLARAVLAKRNEIDEQEVEVGTGANKRTITVRNW